MRFSDSQPAISGQDLTGIEADIGQKLPPPVRALYLAVNGGVPEPYVFSSDILDTVVTEFLPLKSESATTALSCYQSLVREKGLVPEHFFPFAVEGGGDYFFVDMQTTEGMVYFYRHDTASSEPLLSLGVGFDQFWDSLIDET